MSEPALLVEPISDRAAGFGPGRPIGPDHCRAAFEELREQVKHAVDQRSALLLTSRVEQAGAYGDRVHTVVSALRGLVLRGGQRFRPAVLAASYEACGGPGGADTVVMAGVALELFGAYLRSRDDWMAKDDLRPDGVGAPGQAAAILTSDLAAGLAQEALLATPVGVAQLIEGASEFATVYRQVVIGRLLDSHTVGHDVRAPTRIGAALAGAQPLLREALDRFADPLSVAWQLRDELLVAFGDPALTGKSPAGAFRQGKRTALVVEMQRDAQQGKRLERVLGNPSASAADIAEVLAHMEESGVRRRIEARLSGLVETAIAALDELPLTARGRAVLAGAALSIRARA